MIYEQVLQSGKMVGVHAVSQTPLEATTLKWIWEHHLQVVGMSVGISGEIMLAFSFDAVKPEKPKEELITPAIKKRIEERQEKMF